MAKTIQQILAAPNMIGSIQAMKTGVPNPYDPAFLSIASPTAGDYGSYTKVDGTRETAQLVQYGAESKRVAQKGVTRVNVKLAHAFEHMMHDPVVLQNLMMVDRSDVQGLAIAEIGRQTGLFKTRFDNLRIAAIGSMLALGAIYFDGDGNLLPSATGAVLSITFAIPQGNTGQLDVFGTGTIIDASWATAGTDIVGQIATLKDASIRKTGYEITTAYYGANVMGYLCANTSIRALTVANPAVGQAMLQNMLPDGTLGLKWRKAGSGCFMDQAGVLQTTFPADGVTFTPEITRDVYELLEGTYPVPTNIGAISADAVGAAGSVTLARGMFAYAHVLSDPVTIKQLAGDTFLPVWKVPGALFIADVTP